MPQYNKEEVAESLAFLRKHVKPGTTVYTVLRHVSRSGMMREISLYVIHKREPMSITWHAARVLKSSMNKGNSYWALRVGGCGMDMGFYVVNSLSYAIHGYKDIGQAGAIPRRGHYRAGYSIRHEWL
jgi:hypothetical protein